MEKSINEKKGLVKDLFKPMSNGASRANAHITT